jgi:DDE superfamily endonuclease
VFVKTTELAAVAAAHSVDPVRWQSEFSAVLDRIAPRFRRYEPLRHAGELMAGMVSGLDRKNCWTIAEHRGTLTPDGLQHLLARASWDADAVRDDLRDYVIDAFGDPGAILVVDLYRHRHRSTKPETSRKASTVSGCNASTAAPQAVSRTPKWRCT